MLTKTLAQEAAPHGVRVLAVGPGAIKTSINRPIWSDPKSFGVLLPAFEYRLEEENQKARRSLADIRSLLGDIIDHVSTEEH